MASPEPFADARARIEAAIAVSAEAPLAGLTVEWPNEPFTLPAYPAPWLSVAMTGDLLEARELGPAGMWGEEGTLFVHVAVARGTGSAGARAIGKAVANLFRGVAGPVRWPRASIGAGQVPQGEGLYWVLTVTIDWAFTDR